MTSPPSTARWQALTARLALVLLVALGAAGCVVIPTSATPARDIPPEQREAFKLGETRRADILMRYGEPEVRLDADRVLVYRWTRLRAVIVVGPGLGGIPVTDAEALFLEFGADGRLVRMGMATAWGDDDIARQAESWARGGSLLPQPK